MDESMGEKKITENVDLRDYYANLPNYTFPLNNS